MDDQRSWGWAQLSARADPRGRGILDNSIEWTPIASELLRGQFGLLQIKHSQH